MVGLGPIIKMWKTAQDQRRMQEHTESDVEEFESIIDVDLSQNSEDMLKTAVNLLKNDKSNEKSQLDALINCLQLSKVVKKEEKNAEFTWYKLPEWLQVEYVEIFGSYMHHRPWYQFPFTGMVKVSIAQYFFKNYLQHLVSMGNHFFILQKYFEIVFKEVKVVMEKHGIAKAIFSEGFMTSFVPGIVMAQLFAQMSLLALPITSYLGDEYSPAILASQFEHLVVLSSNQNWKEIHPDIEAENIVPGLYMLKVPSLDKFTNVLKNLAINNTNEDDMKILTISSHSSVQMRVSFSVDSDEEFQLKKTQLAHIFGVTEKFDFTLPTVGQNSEQNLPYFVAYEVLSSQLLLVLREIKNNPSGAYNGVHVDQIYDFWA